MVFFGSNKTGPSADPSNETGVMNLYECIQILVGQAGQNRITVLDAAMQPLAPETAHDVDDLQAIETMIVHGALGSGITYRGVWH